jgi:Rrf2 family protein
MLSAKAKYGLKAALYLALHEGEGGILVSDIATSQRIPKKFLDAILLELKNNGLLSSKKGKGGGYMLAKPAAKVTVGEIIRILDGPIAPVACVSQTAYRPCLDCQDEEACLVRGVMQKVRDATALILDNTSLRDMTATPRPKMILNYDI